MIGGLFDHFVGAGEQCRRHRKAKGFCGLRLIVSWNLVACSIGMSVGFAPLRILSQSGVQKFAVFPFCGYDFRSLFRLSRLVGLAKQCLRPTILFVVKRTLPRSSFIEPGRRSASVEPQKLAAPTQSDGLPKPRGNGFGWPGPIQFQIETLIARIIQPLRHQGRQKPSRSMSRGGRLFED